MSDQPATSTPPMVAEQADRLSALFEAHADRLYRLGRRLVSGGDAALDLVQETFLKAARSPESVPLGLIRSDRSLARLRAMLNNCLSLSALATTKCGVTVVAAFVLGSGTARAQDLFDLRKVADGVYAAVAQPRTPINCNAAVVVYDEGVLVVDTHSRPSSARALIRQIKGVTDKPVRYAVNSHFHWDHAQGNHAYPVAFPKQVAIVASEATRENLQTHGMQRVKGQIESGSRQVEDLKRRIAGENDAAARATLREELRQQEDYLTEIRSLELTLPDLTFDKSLILHRPDRDVVLLFLGRGHTSGDVVAYLPKQRVVATGDLLHGWMPFMGDSYPPEWVATLDALDKLDFDHIIGGHGAVKPKSHLRFFRNYLADLIAEVRRARDRGETLEQAGGSVAAALKPKYEAGMDGRFAGSVGANIEKVYKDLEAKRY